MDERLMIERHLTIAQTHVIRGEEQIARQKEIIAELERDGHEEAGQTACKLLSTFEKTQVSQVRDKDRLRAELAALR